MKFELLDPRPTAEAAANNEKIFASGPVLGIEVTVQALAARCSLGNIDPQHTDGDSGLTAIEAMCRNLQQNSTNITPSTVFATVRADLDSVGAMAVAWIAMSACWQNHAYSGNEPEQALQKWDPNELKFPTGLVTTVEMSKRIDLIAVADKFGHGAWPGPRPMPSNGNPWPVTGTAAQTRELAAIAAAVADHSVPIGQRVEWMRQWLLTGEEPCWAVYKGLKEPTPDWAGIPIFSQPPCSNERYITIWPVSTPGDDTNGWEHDFEITDYRARVEAERMEMIEALDSGTILLAAYYPADAGNVIPARIERIPYAAMAGNLDAYPIAIVETTHRAALDLGYCLAPVVIARNPDFRWQGGEPHVKYTIAQYREGYCDREAVKSELAALELGWGGSPTIIGSPQGVASSLTTEQVVKVVSSHLL